MINKSEKYLELNLEQNQRQTLLECRKSFAHKMGTSVIMLMSNSVQVPEDEDEDQEYTGLGDLFMAEKE